MVPKQNFKQNGVADVSWLTTQRLNEVLSGLSHRDDHVEHQPTMQPLTVFQDLPSCFVPPQPLNNSMLVANSVPSMTILESMIGRLESLVANQNTKILRQNTLLESIESRLSKIEESGERVRRVLVEKSSQTDRRSVDAETMTSNSFDLSLKKRDLVSSSDDSNQRPKGPLRNASNETKAYLRRYGIIRKSKNSPVGVANPSSTSSSNDSAIWVFKRQTSLNDK
ncbi:hypothetical protein ACOME3_007089 [Neoechinorhynchus agilis]